MMNSFVYSSEDISIDSTDHLLRVLIVDVHEIFRHGLRELINNIEGFEVVAEARTCKDALVLAQQMRIDLVILDMYLQDGDVIEATRQLRQMDTYPPHVIILSAVIYDDMLIGAILAGALGYLTKDMPADDIANALKGFRRGELALRPAVATHLVRLLVQKYNEIEAELAACLQNVFPTTDISPSQTDELNRAASSSNTAIRLLTHQEAKVFQFLRHGQSNKQIATQLSISPYTVGKHVQNILRKLGVTNRTQAVLYTSFEGDITL